VPTPEYKTPLFNRLSLRVAAGVAGASGTASAAALWVASGGRLGATLGLALAVALVSAVVAYRSVHARIAARLELARRALREARKRRFEALADLPSGTSRDEIDALILQVYRAGRALQQEIERLENAESFRRDFLGDVSHELRTPIFAVAGFSETLLDGALDDDRVRRRFVEKILANARRLESLTRDLTAIADLETGRMQLHPTAIDLRTLAGETVDALQRMADDRQVSLTISIPDGLPPALADRDRLRQVLSNLVENATKYNQPGGRVEVTARRLPSGELRVSVIDDGIGIPVEDIPRLTERFFRVDKSRSREQGGTGLGLAIVKHILEAHGQRLSVESRPGYGSSFAFSVPATVAAEALAPAEP
jgi:two-component system phosphate regulon sensor histidine kinase PhoR